MLKQKFLFAVTSLFALMLVSNGVRAQYDDMYYDPDEFRSTEVSRDYYDDGGNDIQERSNDRSFRRSDAYADDYHDYYYSSRIRRFNRPMAGFGYYDPVYVDVAYYDPFFRPGFSTALIYNNFNRFGRFNSAFARPVFTPYGVRYVDTRYGAFGGWNDPFFYGSRFDRGFYGNPYYGGGAFGGFGGFGAGVAGGYYCPPAWGNGNSYVVPNSVQSRPVSNVPRAAATTSIADRVARQRQANPTPRATSRTLSPSDRATTSAPRSRSVSPSSSRSIDRSRTTVAPRSRSSSNTRSAAPTRTRSYTPSQSTTPTRSATPTRSRSYTPSRSASPTRSRSYTPSRSASPTRSYTPSRSTSPTRSYSPSRSSSTRSYTPSRSSGGSSRSASPSRTSRSRSGGGQ